tara:strand:+ start:819 stop:1061 length:243 start_codon:yes stop_codon:yes gene_type:complete
MEKTYIVVEESWEYNDEDYRQSDDEPYVLSESKLYTKEEAEKLRDELNEKHHFFNSEWDVKSNKEIKIRINPCKIIKLTV